MDLVDFLGWNDNNGIYRSQIDGEFYRVVDNILEIYDFDLLEWEDCDMPINKHHKLMSVEKVGVWSEGFEIHNEEEWELVKTRYLQKGYDVLESTMLTANNYLEDGIVFYMFLYAGCVQIIKNRYTVKRNLVLKPIDWRIKFYTRYVRRAKLDTASLFEKEYTAKWHSTDVLDTLKE